jgi:signal transduction histidine kinase
VPVPVSPSLRRALAALAAIGVVVSAVPLALAIHSVGGHHRDLIAVFGPLIGAAFIGTGLLAWARRPENRFGALMVAVGFSYSLSGLIVSTDPWLFIAGLALLPLPYAILYHILLAFPSGRLRRTAERVLVATSYLSATVLHWIEMLFQDTTRQGLPENHLLVSNQPGFLRAWIDGRFSLGIFLLACLGVVLADRWNAASRSQRRALAPVYVSGSLVMALFAVWYAAGIAELSESFQEWLERARVIALATVPFAFLAGLLRSRVAGAAAVSELVVRLGAGREGRGGLRDALAEALGDPTLELLFWLPERRTWVDAAGSPIELPAAGSGRACTPVEEDGRPLAMLVHDPSLADDRELVRAVGGAASLALANELLAAELRAKVQELRASRARIVESADNARRRIERDLHDGAQQQLVALSLALRLARSRLEDDPPAARELLDAASHELDSAIRDLRELARGIHPAVLSDRGLTAALEALAQRTPLPVEIGATPERRLPEPVEAAAYYVVAEAVTNVVKYAEATHVRVDVSRSDGQVVVQVADDGIGGADPDKGSGLRGLSDRVEALDGRLEVRSERQRGTQVRAVIPV